jgi:hypothetical protein
MYKIEETARLHLLTFRMRSAALVPIKVQLCFLLANFHLSSSQLLVSEYVYCMYVCMYVWALRFCLTFTLLSLLLISADSRLPFSSITPLSKETFIQEFHKRRDESQTLRPSLYLCLIYTYVCTHHVATRFLI